MFGGLLLTAQSLPATLADESSLSESESGADAESRIAYDRFLTLLRKQPRPGTALDRVYAFHVEQGTLDEFAASLKDEASSGDADGSAAMLLGLVELQRARDSEAATALQDAESKRPDDPFAAWFYARAMLRLGQAEAATEAFERAIQRSPAKSDLLQIYQELGRAHRRSRQPENAADVWKRMEQQFPNDVRVKEQIAVIQYEEGDFEAALTRYSDLAKQHTDPYQAATCAMTAGELKLKLGRPEEALKDFEGQLAKLDPESWLYRDARRRIENVFLRTDDLAGLVAYYETWLKTHPEDLDAISRVGRTLGQQGRLEDARGWYTKALERAPSDIPLREAMIEQLIREEKYADAIAQYEQLHRFDSSNADHVEEWGLLYLNCRDLPQDERRAKAAEVWQTLITDRPDDPVTISRVADLLRRAELSEKSIELYQKAITLAPGEPQYREYLGEYFQQLKRTEEALAIWNSMAEGELRTTDNLVRLSEVLQRFRYREEALTAMQAACELTPTFAHRIRYARLLRDRETDVPRNSVAETNPIRESRGPLALQQLDIAESIAESEDERDVVIDERIKTLVEIGQLEQKTLELAAELSAGTSATVDRWRTLALYCEAGSQMPSAIEAITASLKVDGESVASWTVAAGLFEKSGRNGDAAEANRTLAVLDRRFLTEYLKKIATLEQKLGRLKQAQQAGRDLLAAAPGNPENFQFYANLCFQLGQKEEGLKALRRSVRANPSDEDTVLALARALSDQLETAEAIELYWRAFDQASDVDRRSAIVTSLAELHLRTNQFDRLLQKLESRGTELSQQRDIAICLVAAFRAAGDLHSARQKLESLLDADSRDVSLLADLSKLAEDEDDLEAAADYQRRINTIAPSDDGRSRLAGILLKLGEISEAETLWVRASETESEPHELFRSIDHLMSIDSTDTARKLCERILQRDTGNWEAMFRIGLLDWRSGAKSEAMKHFDAIVAMKKDPNTPSVEAAQRTASRTPASQMPLSGYPGVSGFGASSDPAPFVRRGMHTAPLLMLLAEDSEDARTAAMYNAMYNGGQYGISAFGAAGSLPDDLGEARIVGLMAQYQRAKEAGTEQALTGDRERLAENDIAAAWDAYYLLFAAELISPDSIAPERALVLAERLARLGDLEGKALFLMRSGADQPDAEFGFTVRNRRWLATPDQHPSVAVSPDRLPLIVQSFEDVLEKHPEWLENHDRSCVRIECERLGRLDLLDALAGRLVRDHCSVAQLFAGLQFSLSRQSLDVEAALKLMDRIEAAPDAAPNPGAAYFGYVATFPHDAVWELTQRAINEKDWTSLRRILNWFLDFKVRHAGDLTKTSPLSGNAVGNLLRVFAHRASDSDQNAVDYPEFSRHFDDGDLRLLSQISAMIITAAHGDQLSVWYDEQKPLSASTRALYLELIQSGFAWWDKSEAEAVVHLIRAVELAPGEVQLRIKLVELCEHIGKNFEALALLDKLPENDPVLLKARELKALDLAFRTNNKERARQAAERLYGLQLDGESTVLLIARLKKLGMREMAEEVQARTKKNEVAHSTPTSLQLLEQYDKQGNTAAAAQIAHQLLRRTSAYATSSFPVRGNRQDDVQAIRSRAFDVLKKSGQLTKLIDRQKEQLENSPNSKVILATLIEYLRADGRTDELRDFQNRLLAQQPKHSAKTILSTAEQLQASGQKKEACDKYLELMIEHPATFAGKSNDVLPLFQAEGRTEELAEAVLKSGLMRFQYTAHFVLPLVLELLHRPQSRDTAAALISEIVDVAPTHGPQVIGLVSTEQDWTTPELFPVLSGLFVPSSAAQAATPSFAWSHGYDQSSLAMDEKKLDGVGYLSTLWDALESGDRRKEFIRDVEAAQTAFPQWPAGDILLAIAAFRDQRPQDTHRLLRKFIEEDSRKLPEVSSFTVAALLISFGEEFKTEALDLLDKSVLRNHDGNVDFGTPAAILMGRLYRETNQTERGRQVIRDRSGFFEGVTTSANNKTSESDQMIIGRYAAAAAMTKLGDPLSAFALLKHISLQEEHELTQRVARPRLAFGSARIVRENVQKAVLFPTVRLTASAAITARVLTEEVNRPAAQESSSEPPRLDPVPTLRDTTGPTSTFDCEMLRAMRSAAWQSANQRADVRTLAEALSSAMQRVDSDPSLIVAGVFVVLTSRDEESVAAINAILDKYLQRPLLPRTEVEVFSVDRLTRQDTEIGFAFVATQIEKEAVPKPLADLMYERGLAIARQWPDKRYLSALLHQRGLTLQARGNKREAEESWSDMLDVLLADSDDARPGITPSAPSKGIRPSINIGEELRKTLLRDVIESP